MSDRLRWLLPCLALAACTDARSVAEPGIAVSVAPLTLEGITEATYSITVKRGAEVVWTQIGLQSTRYGDGAGSLTYVGRCDAEGPNTVELTLLELRDATHALVHPSEFVNPSATGPIVRTGITCAENADVEVVFNLVVARSANQGFFDVAVAFDDVFCSAKLDCKPEFLHDPRTTAREDTVVVAFACTSGDDGASWLYLSDVELVCTDADPGAAPALPEIRQLVTQAGRTPGRQGAAAPLVFDWARYQEEETLPGLEKCFWNTAVGLDRAAIGGRKCSVRAVAHASETPLAGMLPPSDRVTPSIAFEVEVIDAAGALCSNRALNVPLSGVGIVYTEATRPAIMEDLPFTSEYACGGAASPVSFACAAGTSDMFAAELLPGGGPGVRVSIDSDSAVYGLPAGATLTGCCAHACCETPAP